MRKSCKHYDTHECYACGLERHQREYEEREADEMRVMGEFHTIITKVYNSDGECIAITNSTVPGEYEPDEATRKYWAWLDKRRGEAK